MKPLARLYLSRQRLYEKRCDHTFSYTEDNSAVNNCEVGPWQEWSTCSLSCGKGIKYRQRVYKNPSRKNNCTEILTQRATCYGVQRHCRHSPNQQRRDDPECELSSWGDWSSCSVACGKGVKTRNKKYRNRNAFKKCAAGVENPPRLQETIECRGERGECGADEVNII